MKKVHLTLAFMLGSTVLAGPALAEAGGGGGTPTSNKEVAACAQRLPNGQPVRKLSSEEICPIYQFWREDCRQDGQLGLVNEGTVRHCSRAALGLADQDIATGSVR